MACCTEVFHVGYHKKCRQTEGSTVFLSSPNLLASLISLLPVRYTLYLQ